MCSCGVVEGSEGLLSVLGTVSDTLHKQCTTAFVTAGARCRAERPDPQLTQGRQARIQAVMTHGHLQPLSPPSWVGMKSSRR